METTEITRVTAKARKSTDGTLWLFTVKCPHCGFDHIHGAGSVATSPDKVESGYFGHRQAHCGAGEYFVESASR